MRTCRKCKSPRGRKPCLVCSLQGRDLEEVIEAIKWANPQRYPDGHEYLPTVKLKLNYPRPKGSR